MIQVKVLTVIAPSNVPSEYKGILRGVGCVEIYIPQLANDTIMVGGIEIFMAPKTGNKIKLPGRMSAGVWKPLIKLPARVREEICHALVLEVRKQGL